MPYTFVMRIFKRNSEKESWEQEGIVAKPFTKKEWEENVIGAKSCFEDLGGHEVHPNPRTVDYTNALGTGRIIYELQHTNERQEKITHALLNAMKQYTLGELADIMRNDLSPNRFNWTDESDFLNQTTQKEFGLALQQVVK